MSSKLNAALSAALLALCASAQAQRAPPSAPGPDMTAPVRVVPPSTPPSNPTRPSGATGSSTLTAPTERPPPPGTDTHPDPTGPDRPGPINDLRFKPDWTATPRDDAVAPAPQPFPLLHADRIEPNELLVLWPVAQTWEGISRIEQRYGLQPAERVDLRMLGWTLGVYRFPSNRAAVDLRWRLMRDDPKLMVDFNTRYAATGEARQYALAQIGLPIAITDGGAGVRMGMLDGPLGDPALVGANRVMVRSFLQPGEATAGVQHGTAVALLMAGRPAGSAFSGVAPSAFLRAAAVLRTRDQRDEATTRAVLSGLDWLLSERVRVINASLAGPPNRLLAAAVYATLARSVVIVAAVGNDGPDAPPNYPAAYPGVIGVTATDARNQAYVHANRGQHLTISAPGVDLWVPIGASGQYLSGTSFAAAVVSGAIARMLEASPTASASDMAQRLCQAARDLGPPGRDPVFGCGLLQLPPDPVAARRP